MWLKAELDVDSRTRSRNDLVLMVDVEAPSAPEPDGTASRDGACLEVVLDRCGSADPAVLEGLLDAVAAVVHRLEVRDTFGLVTYGDSADVVVPAGPLTDSEEVVERLAAITPGATGGLADGYLRGLEELRRVVEPPGTATLMVLSGCSEGCAAADPARLKALAADARASGIVTSTLLYGTGEDSGLAALSVAGGGRHRVVSAAAGAGAAIAEAVDGLPTRVARSASLHVHVAADVELLAVQGREVAPGSRTHTVDLGDLDFDEQRRVALDLRLRAKDGEPLRLVATLELRYRPSASSVEERIVLPAILQEPVTEDRAGASTGASGEPGDPTTGYAG